MDIVIAGGSAAGLFAGLLLARAGHHVLVLERDSLQPGPDVESAAAAAFRPSAPQIVQPHIVMARCRQLLIERLPDVYAGLLAAGVAEAPLRTQMPDSLPDTAAWPGDERLTPMMTRRSTVDWVLQRAAAAEPRVTMRSGVKVAGLLTAPARPGGRPPHVTGVRTDCGDLAADLVVDATGRRSPLDDWLTQLGAQATATWRAECGIAYFSRHYRVRPGADLPGLLVTRIVVALDEFLAGKWGGDNDAVQLAVAPLAADRRFRTVRDPQVFTAVLQTIPTYAAWLDVMDPITDVFPMAGLHNTLRRLVVDGIPVATGLHAIGDSVLHHQPDPRARPRAGPVRRRRPGRHHRRARRRSRRAGARPGPSGRRARGAVLPGSGRDRCRAAGDDAAHHLRRAAAAASRDSRPGHLFPATHGRVLRPGRLPRVLEDQRDGMPARRGLHRPGCHSSHTRSSQAAWRHTTGRPAHPRAAPHRPY